MSLWLIYYMLLEDAQWIFLDDKDNFELFLCQRSAIEEWLFPKALSIWASVLNKQCLALLRGRDRGHWRSQPEFRSGILLAPSPVSSNHPTLLFPGEQMYTW